MKKILKGVLDILLKINFTSNQIERVSKYVKNRKREMEEVVDKKFIRNFSKKKIVRHGPFKGMKYIESSSLWNVYLPKLLGSYEREIHPAIAKICKTKYSQILDIGCAEGYYAIGFALNIPKAKIFAYDTQKEAREKCEKMVCLNKVEDKVEIRSTFTPNELKDFPFAKKSLVMCDCEGCEKILFTRKTLKNLKKTDLLIELHDNVDINISTYITELFKKTHKQVIFESIDDTIKAQTYKYKELKKLDIYTKKRILEERRETIMKWIFLTHK